MHPASGSAVSLSIGGISSRFLRVTAVNRGRYIFSDGGRGNLRIGPNGRVDFKEGATGMWAQFELLSHGENGVRLQSFGHKRQHNRDIFLTAFPRDGALTFSAAESFQEASIFTLHIDTTNAAPRPVVPTVTLSREDVLGFERDGVLVLRALIDKSLVDNALRGVNSRLPQADSWEADENGDPNFKPSWDKDDNPIQDLLHASPLRGVAEQLLGASLQSRFGGAQLALRFPLPPAKADRPPKDDDQWHIDGMNKTTHMSPFQLLVGVALSDQPTDDCGNLHYWPAQHRTVFDAVKRQSARRAHDMGASAPALSADPWYGEKPSLPAEQRSQLKLQAGDVVLLHQKTPHSVGLNRSPNVRRLRVPTAHARVICITAPSMYAAHKSLRFSLSIAIPFCRLPAGALPSLLPAQRRRIRAQRSTDRPLARIPRREARERRRKLARRSPDAQRGGCRLAMSVRA